MSYVIEDCSDNRLPQIIETQWFQFGAQWGFSPYVEVYDGRYFKRLDSGIPNPMWNVVCLAKLTCDTLVMKIEENIEYFKRSRLPWIWWVGPSSKPKDLGKHLVDYGFIHRYDMPGMAIELQRNIVSISTPEKFNIIQVNDTDTLKIWVKIASICFPIVIGEFKDNFFEFESSIGFRNDRISYVGYMEDEPVAASTVFLCSGVAGIYNVGTIPEARRKGIGAAMTWVPLKHAVSLGYKVGILHSSRMGYRLYRKMGFKRCCMISNYMWQP